MDRLAQAFARARREQRAAFVAYLCAGDPDLDTSFTACRALLEAGVDVLELGVPFSDPLADGLTNQLAAQRALAAGTTPAQVLELVRRLRATTEAPIVFYTYFNLVLARGLDPTIREARAAGVDGLLVLDLPPEESAEFTAACRRHDMKIVRLVAPTTPPERLPLLCADATGFIYYVSREGVTGERGDLAADIPEAVARIRAHTTQPVVVGFGISTRDHVRTIGRIADGVVVGSALVNVVAAHAADPAALAPALRARAADLVAGLTPVPA
jgi:tryptophan synthase alpha chain